MSNNRFSFISQANVDEPAIDNEDGVPSLLPLRISFPPLSPLLKKLLINQSHLLTIDHNMDDSDSSGDDESLISLYRTNYFIQDAIMYKPWKIFPPSRERGTYVCQLHPWLLYRSSRGEFTASDREFIIKCLEDLRNWNSGEETEHRARDDNVGYADIFEEWPERIRQNDNIPPENATICSAIVEENEFA